MRRWSLGTLTALVVAIVVATGVLNQTAAAAGVEWSLSFEPMTLEVRAAGLAIQIKA